MLIDDVTIRIKAGSGGIGAVAFNKNLMSLGPAGGDGGNGGSVYFEGVADISALIQFRNKKEVAAGDGKDGKAQFADGNAGEDLILKVPVGTVVHNTDTGLDEEIIKTGERILVARGGKGGRGNFQFRSSTNTSPRQFEEGRPGQAFTIRLELKLIADVGLVGLPNAGKSSLLNELTSAKSKVSNYPFTTLEPNLGVYYELIIADLPGLIEGASTGKGLGTKFLQHVERTKVLFHLVSAESDDVVKDYKTIKKELKNYNEALGKKKEYLFLSKSDAVSDQDLKKKLSKLRKLNSTANSISIHDESSLLEVQTILNKIKEDK